MYHLPYIRFSHATSNAKAFDLKETKKDSSILIIYLLDFVSKVCQLACVEKVSKPLKIYIHFLV